MDFDVEKKELDESFLFRRQSLGLKMNSEIGIKLSNFKLGHAILRLKIHFLIVNPMIQKYLVPHQVEVVPRSSLLLFQVT